MPSVCEARALTYAQQPSQQLAPTVPPWRSRSCSLGLGVISGEISSFKQADALARTYARFERLRRVRRATRILSQTAEGGEPP